jgi:hypothetical protein
MSGNLKLNTALGGSIALTPTNTASNITVTIPATTGTLNTSGSVNVVPAGSAAAPAITTTGDTNTGIFFPAADTIAFTEGGVESARIDSSGNFAIGTTTPYTSIGGGTFNTTSNKGFSINNGATYTGLSGASGNEGLWFTSGAFRVYSSLSVGVFLNNGATSWTATSDERAKDIIEPIENAATKVTSLRAVIGKYKTDDATTRRPFLIAQDVQKVLPEAVNEGDGSGMLGLQYTDVIPLLVAAIQELTARLEALENK